MLQLADKFHSLVLFVVEDIQVVQVVAGVHIHRHILVAGMQHVEARFFDTLCHIIIIEIKYGDDLGLNIN